MESRTKQRTRRHIQNTLIALIQENGLDKVTVSAITKRAQINRSTFYEYYTDIFELLTEIEDEFLQEFTVHMSAISTEIDARHADVFFSGTMDLLNHYGDTFFILLGPKGDRDFPLRFIENAKPLILSVFGEEELTPQIDMLITFEISGIIGVYSNWFESDKKVPLEEIVQTMQDILYAGMTAVRNRSANIERPPYKLSLTNTL